MSGGAASGPAPSCAQCGVAMTAGFLADGYYSGERQAQWVSGVPSQGLRALLGTVTGGDRIRRDVTTYRCPGCGRLESFALPVR